LGGFVGCWFWFWFGESASYDVTEPVCHAIGDCIYGGVGAVYADAFQGETEEGLLLWVVKGEGF
jgi:hypothetical protein